MNQILYTIENHEEKGRMKSIILFFALTIIIFGIIMATMGGFRIAEAKIARDEAIEAAKIPEVTLNSESNKAIINVKHSKEIKNIIYSWNEGEETVITKNTTEDITESIDIPAGTNTLNVQVFDVEGRNTQISKEYTYEGSYMDLSVIDNKTLKIVVTDMAGLQSVKYSWNSEDEVISYPDQENATVIEISSDIPVGLNTIRVVAINTRNISEEKEVTIKGVTKPTRQITYDNNRTRLIIKINDDQGIESYSYKLSSAPISDIARNGQIIPEFKEKLTQVISESKSGNSEKSITEQLPFQKGFNYLEITITNIEGVQETYAGWCAK